MTVDTYHKFVKTTPKPSATKKSSGELEPLPLLLLLLLFVLEGMAVCGLVVMVAEAVTVAARATTWAASKTWLMMAIVPTLGERE